MKKKKLTAWLLAVAMTLGSVNPVFASEAELFTDGGTETMQMQEEEVPENETEENEETRQRRTQIPVQEDLNGQTESVENSLLFSNGAETASDTQVFSDGTGADDYWADAVEVPLAQNKVLTSDSDARIKYFIDAPEVGTYQISEIRGEETYAHAVKIDHTGIHYIEANTAKPRETITFFIQKVNSITNIQASLSNEITGYIELGGANLVDLLYSYNPEITVTFEDNTTKICHYNEGLEGYGVFQPIANGEADLSNLSAGNYSFSIFNTAEYNIRTNSHTYLLKSIDEIGDKIPEIKETSSLTLQQNYNNWIVYKISAPIDKKAVFKIQYDHAVESTIYNAEGRFEFGTGESVLEVVVPANENRYIVVKGSEGAAIESVSAEMTVNEDVWNNQLITETGEYTFALSDTNQFSYSFTAPENGYYKINSEADCTHSVWIEEDSQNYSGSPLVFLAEAGKTYSLDTRYYGEAGTTSKITVSIEKTDAIAKITLTNNQQYRFLIEQYGDALEADVLEGAEQVTITFADGSTITEPFKWGGFDLDGYGYVNMLLLDENGNEVYQNEMTEKTYQLCYQFQNDISTRSNPIYCDYFSVNSFDMPQLAVGETVTVPRNLNTQFFSKFVNTGETARTYEILYEYDQTKDSQVSNAVYQVVDGHLHSVGADTFVAEPGVVYYIRGIDRYHVLDQIQYSLKELKGIQSIQLIGGLDADKVYIEEFWYPGTDLENYVFEVLYTNGEKEELRLSDDSSYYGSLRWSYGYDDETYEEIRSKVIVYLMDDPNPKEHQLELDFNLISINELDSVRDISNIVGKTEPTEITADTDGTAYFKFTASESGSYQFTQYNAEWIKISRNGFIESETNAGIINVEMQEGETIYGQAVVTPSQNFKISISNVPKIQSIVLKNGKLITDTFLSGVVRQKSWELFDGNILEVTYDNGMTEEVEVGYSSDKVSTYYGQAFARWSSDNENKFGKKEVYFTFDSTNVTSTPYQFTILDERETDLPVYTGEGEYEAAVNYNNAVCFVFKPQDEGTYRMQIRDNLGYLDLDEYILTYPLDFNTILENGGGGEEGNIGGFTEQRDTSWLMETEANEAFCVVINRTEKTPATIQIENIGSVESMEISSISDTYIEEFGENGQGTIRIKLDLGNGQKEEFWYHDEESSYVGYISMEPSWYMSMPVQEDFIRFSASEYDIHTDYPVKRIPLSEAELPLISELGVDYTIPVNYNNANCYAFTAPQTGSYLFDVSQNGTDISDTVRRTIYTEEGEYYDNYTGNYPVRMTEGQTLYFTDIRQPGEITVNVRKGNAVTNLELISGAETISREYVVEFLQQWSAEIEKSYFSGCTFRVTFEDGSTKDVSYGETIDGYGELYIFWPRYEGDLDIIDTGDNLTAYFEIAGCSDIKCTLDNITIKNARDFDLVKPTYTGNIYSPVTFSDEDPGHAKSFQFAAQKEALYKITFTDSPSTRELLFASNGDSTAEQAQILVGANVYNIDNIGADSTVYVHADQGDVVYVIYYGQKKSAEIEPLTEEDNKITLSVAESEPILYGDDFYAFNNWKFTAGSDTYGIEDNICGRGSITVTTEGEYAGEKLGETRVSFSLAMDPSIKLDAVAKVVHVDELADSLNLPDITLGMELSFSNVDANYDGNPATVLNISEEGFYEYQIKRKGTGDAGIWMYAEDGSYMEYTRDSDAISLKAGSYIFIDREDAVESLKIVKVDKAELESLYDENKDKTQSDYTPESWAVFSAALKRAEDALAGRLTQEEINEIKEELSKAAAGLEEISVQPTPTPTPSPTPTPTEPVNPPVTYYTIRFDSQGGSAVSSQSLTYGSKVREPQAPTRDGYTLAGWYKESSCTNPWDFAKDTVTSSHTLYAKWEEISQTPEVPAVSEIISRKGYLEVKLGAAITGADGYEYAYSTAGGDWTTAEDYTVLGETKELSYTSTKVPAGIYVVRVRAYKESAEGKRYGAWSEEQWTELPTGTLDAPEILSVKVQGRTVTVKVKGPDGAEGYDAVMGVNGNPIKPTPYSYVIKNQKTTTLVFENVADGIYYIGVHAYSKENGVKTFSKWSAQKQAEVAAGDLPEAEAPDAPTIIGHYAKKGYLKVRIAEGAEGEQGYEYAYSTKGGAWTSPEDYTLFGRTPLLYRASTKILAGVYAVKVRAFIRVNGERIYSPWSQPEWVELPTGTLKAPKIKNVKVNGNTVTLTLTGVKGAAGYDAVLGRSHNPAKPTSYAYVKKNQRTVTITFRNVKAGTYYIGAHAYAKEAGKKVFSKWSSQKKIAVK